MCLPFVATKVRPTSTTRRPMLQRTVSIRSPSGPQQLHVLRERASSRPSHGRHLQAALSSPEALLPNRWTSFAEFLATSTVVQASGPWNVWIAHQSLTVASDLPILYSGLNPTTHVLRSRRGVAWDAFCLPPNVGVFCRRFTLGFMCAREQGENMQ